MFYRDLFKLQDINDNQFTKASYAASNLPSVVPQPHHFLVRPVMVSRSFFLMSHVTEHAPMRAKAVFPPSSTSLAIA